MPLDQGQLAQHDNMVLTHIADVKTNLGKFITELHERGEIHDASKLQSPEREVYAENFSVLAKTVYGSPEYDALLVRVKPAIEHHYARNRHHPEFHKNGIDDMDLVDLMEMISDWAASTKKNKNGNVHKSIEINTKRFGMAPQLAKIFTNTVNRYF